MLKKIRLERVILQNTPELSGFLKSSSVRSERSSTISSSNFEVEAAGSFNATVSVELNATFSATTRVPLGTTWFEMLINPAIVSWVLMDATSESQINYV